MGRSFQRIALFVTISLAVPLFLATMGRSQAAGPIMLSEQETKTIADLLAKKQVRFEDDDEIAYVDPGLWYAIDLQQKKNLTILLARSLAARNKTDFSSINVASNLTGRMLATYTMSEGFRIGE
jgi:hypothetical protein